MATKTTSVIFKGVDQISPAIKGAGASLAGLEKGLGAVDNSAKAAGDSVRDNLIKQIEEAKKKIGEFAKQNLKVEQGQALAELNKLNRELEKLDKPITPKVDDTSIKAAGVSLKDFLEGNTEKARDLADQLRNLSGIVRDIGDSFNQVADASNRAFLAFDTAKTKVATLSNESELYTQQAIDLTGALRNQVTSTEILTAQYDILSSGFSNAADASEIARVSVLGAKAGFTDTATVADAATSVLNAYGLSAGDAANLVDQLAVVQDKGKTTIGQYAGQLGKVAPIAASAGVKLKELNAAVASVTINGVKTETAVSGIRQAIINLIRPTGDAEKVLSNLLDGTGFESAAALLQVEGLTGVLELLREKGFDSSEQLSKIFTDVDGLTAIVPLLNDGLKGFNENLGALDNALGKTEKGFNIVAESAEGKIATAINKINEALVNLGRGVATSFEPLTTAIGNAAALFNSLPQPIQVVIGGLIGITGAALTSTAALIALGAAAPAFTQGLALVTKAQIALGLASAATTPAIGATTTALGALGTTAGIVSAGVKGVGASIAGVGTAATAGAVALNTAISGVSISLSTIGGILAGAGALIGTLALKAAGAIASIITALAPLAIKLALVLGAIESIKNTVDLFGFINANEAEDAIDKIIFKSSELQAALKDVGDTGDLITDKLFGGFDKVENPIQGAALAITNLTNALIGADSGASKFGSQFGLVTQQQVEAQRTAIAYADAISVLGASYQGSLQIVSKFGTALEFEQNVTKLSVEQKKELEEQLEKTNKNLKEEISQLTQLGQVKGVDQAANNLEIKSRETLLKQGTLKLGILAKEKQATEEVAKATKKKVDDELRAETEAFKERLKRAEDDATRKRGRAFDQTAKDESKVFEQQSRDTQRAFERSLNDEKKAFDTAQQAAKKTFEQGLLAEQKAFNEGEKAKDESAQKQRQEAERAFNASQQAAKAAFDKAQQQAARDFDAKQNLEKLDAEGKFATRRAEIERKLQLDAAANPEERARLEAEFKAADEKAAKEKAAFAQLKAEEEAFALKQQQAKIAFDEQQKAAAAALEAQQQAAKVAFDDAQKAKDKTFEAEKQAARLAFEDTLKAKRDALDLAENEKKQAFEDALEAKKIAFEDEERAKKDAFETAQQDKKIAFEDEERKKKQAFEDNLKVQEAKFKAEERAKDEASAAKVAAIKANSGTPVVAAKPLATGGTFKAGEQLLVGERGAELVKFGSSGTVTNAANTRQILSSSNNASNSVNMARVEGLLSQLVGKMDRPNIAVQTSENPSDVVVKVQREIARASAVRAGI